MCLTNLPTFHYISKNEEVIAIGQPDVTATDCISEVLNTSMRYYTHWERGDPRHYPYCPSTLRPRAASRLLSPPDSTQRKATDSLLTGEEHAFFPINTDSPPSRLQKL